MYVKRLRPLKRFVLLLDDQPEFSDKGIIVKKTFGNYHMDYLVVAVGENETVDFGAGDRVILASPNAGRRVYVDGILHRLVKISDIIAVLD